MRGLLNKMHALKRHNVMTMLCLFLLSTSCQTDDADKIYQEGRQVTYRVEFSDTSGQIQCVDTILLVIPEQGPLDFRKIVTDQITNIYKYSGNCMPHIEETTGIKETDKRLFLHPPRMDKMIITELGAFPKMFYPVKVGTGGKGTLTIEKGYEQWDGLEISYRDSVVKIIDTSIADIKYDELAFREGLTKNTPIGKVRTSHAFSKKYGWVSGRWTTDTLSIYLYAVDYNW